MVHPEYFKRCVYFAFEMHGFCDGCNAHMQHIQFEQVSHFKRKYEQSEMHGFATGLMHNIMIGLSEEANEHCAQMRGAKYDTIRDKCSQKMLPKHAFKVQ